MNSNLYVRHYSTRRNIATIGARIETSDVEVVSVITIGGVDWGYLEGNCVCGYNLNNK